MRQERWSRVNELFHSALKRGPAERMAFLAEACSNDISLRMEVESLLSADSSAGSFLDRGVARRETTLQPGASLGAYRIDSLIGRGGMGEVYCARDTRLAREVALKVLPGLPSTQSQPAEKAASPHEWEASALASPSDAASASREPASGEGELKTAGAEPDSASTARHRPPEGGALNGLVANDGSLRRRFQNEALLTASVQHPAVVPIYERGELPGGQPFYTMKLVSGRSLRELIGERKALADRLALLPNVIAVADALAHAHSLRILHRDVKPSNIIIGEFGETVLIDWGVAKNLASPARESEPGAISGEADRTAVGMIIGTPAYMSPEQARGLAADERADVFSLGATLYHLLAGQAAYEGDTPAILPKVAQGEYLPLSEKQPDVPAELAAIVEKAMARQPAKRYPSARELAEDLRRFQTGQLVLSHRYTARELLARWARRHRPLLVASAVFLVLAAAGAAFGVRRIIRERDRASHEAEVSQRVSQFMTEMFKVSDPSEARGNKVTAREILDKASSEIESGLQRDPKVQADLMEAMATVYRHLGLYAKARPLAEKAVEKHRELLGIAHPDTLHSMAGLATTELVQGHYVEAEKLYGQVLEIRRRVLGPEHPDTLATISNLVSVQISRGDYAAAAKNGREVLEIQRRVLGPESSQTLATMNNLAVIYLKQGQSLAEAEKIFREVLEHRRRLLGPENTQTLITNINLAAAQRKRGDYAAAEKSFREVLEIQRRVLGAEHPQTLVTMNNLANNSQLWGQLAEAKKTYGEVLEVARRVLGPEHKQTLEPMSGVAEISRLEGHLTEAEKLHREVLEIQRRVLGPENPDTLMSMSNLADDERLLGRYAEAEKLYTQFLDTARRVLGPENAGVLLGMSGLGALHLALKRPTQAENIHREVLETQRRLRGPEHPNTLRSMYWLAEDESGLGRHEEAEKLYRDALEGQRRIFKRDHADIAETMIGLANLEAHQERRDEAEKLYSEALAMCERLFGPHHPDAALSLYGLGALALERGDRSKAFEYLERALERGLSIPKRMEMRDDPALKSLRGEPRFQALLAEDQKRGRAQAREPSTQRGVAIDD